jgi:heme oxygenase
MQATTTRPEGSSVSLADALRARTHALHRVAERSGVVAALLHGASSRPAYALFLRNLLPAYRALEEGLERLRPLLPALARSEVYRAEAIASDLRSLQHLGPVDPPPLLPEAVRYAARIASLGADAPRLAAHAYVRLLGDLNGGVLMRRILARSLELDHAALTFYAFPTADLERLRGQYRAAFDALPFGAAQTDAMLDEAELAFELNIALSEAVLRAG